MRELIRAGRPWEYHRSYRERSRSEHKKGSLFYGSRSMTEDRLRELKIVYRMLRNNESITNRDIGSAIGGIRYSDHVNNIMNTLSDFLPIWESDMVRQTIEFGLLDRTRTIKELEDD